MGQVGHGSNIRTIILPSLASHHSSKLGVVASFALADNPLSGSFSNALTRLLVHGASQAHTLASKPVSWATCTIVHI